MQRTTPMTVALAVACAILLIAGLATLGYGCYIYSNRNLPIQAERDDLRNRNTQGDFISAIEYHGDMEIAAIVSEHLRRGAIQCIGVGFIMTLPFLGFGAVSLRRRSRCILTA